MSLAREAVRRNADRGSSIVGAAWNALMQDLVPSPAPVLGNRRFEVEVGRMLDRRVTRGKAGRPTMKSGALQHAR